MHQLRALIWEFYRVRVRSPYSTIVDTIFPIVTIILYVVLKILINAKGEIQLEGRLSSLKYFRNLDDNPIDFRQGLPRHMCTRILCAFDHSIDAVYADQIRAALRNKCGLDLTQVATRQELIKRLRASLAARVAYKQENVDLNKLNSTSSCYTLPRQQRSLIVHEKSHDVWQQEQQGGSESIFQVGLVWQLNDFGKYQIDIHLTDVAGSSVLHMPYSQGSTYHEYKLPHSDLNAGTHLLEMCISDVVRTLAESRPPPSSSLPPNASYPVPQSTRTGATSAADPYSITPTRTANNATPFQGGNDPRWGNLKLRVRPFPVITGFFIPSAASLLAILLAVFFNVICTVIRVSDANELKIHWYIRLTGLSACHYWLSFTLVHLVHMTIQSLIIAMILAIPTNTHYDPICECSMTIRWLMILTYSFAINMHAIFVSSLFDRTSHILMVTFLLATGYTLYILFILIQWTPYGFTIFYPLNIITMLNPSATFQMLAFVLISVALETSETFSWSHLNERIIGGGFTSWSVSELWWCLFLQGAVWFLLTLISDQLLYITACGLYQCPMAYLSEIFCFNLWFAEPKERLTEDVRTKSATLPRDNRLQERTFTLKSNVSQKKDPNRICCSMRHINVIGPEKLLAYPRGQNPLVKLTSKQLAQMLEQQQQRESEQSEGEKQHVSKYLINRSSSASGVAGRRGPQSGTKREEPILLDEAIQQHIVWKRTQIYYDGLNLDFRYNQISFVLGQPDMKNLLFSTLLGLRTISSGHIIIDGTKYTAASMTLARPQIGYLSEHDVFLNELTIFENLQFFGSLRDAAYDDYDSESAYVLSLLHLTMRKDHLPATLTHRSARKLALGVAAVGYTKLLLLVEPTLNLRWRPRCQVLNLLKKYKSIRSIVIDTSDIDEATAFGDRIVLLKNGRADLDDTPARIAKRLCCGYWLVFEPMTSGEGGAVGQAVNSEALRSLEQLATSMFKGDKLDLDKTSRSIYQGFSDVGGVDSDGGVGADEKITAHHKSSKKAASPGAAEGEQQQQQQHRDLVVLKVHQTAQSTRALCSLLKTINSKDNSNKDPHHHQQGLRGFRLVQLTYESLEDVLVLRMSRAQYPDLPPDLLLSLQHRTQQRAYQRDRSSSNQEQQQQPPVSVREISSLAVDNNNQQVRNKNQTTTPTICGLNCYNNLATDWRIKQQSTAILHSGARTIFLDRLTTKWEIAIALVAMIGALLIISVALVTIQASFRPATRESLLTVAPSLPTTSLSREQLHVPSTVDDGSRSVREDKHMITREQLQLDEGANVSSPSSSKLGRASSGQLETSSGAGNYYSSAASNHMQDSNDPFAATFPLSAIVHHLAIKQLYRNRVGFYIVTDGGDGGGNQSATLRRRRQQASRRQQWTGGGASLGDLVGLNEEHEQLGVVDIKHAALGQLKAGSQLDQTVQSQPQQLQLKQQQSLINKWIGNKNLVGFVDKQHNESDAKFVFDFVSRSRDSAAGLVLYDPTTRETTLAFEPHLAHAMLAGFRLILDFEYLLQQHYAARLLSSLNISSSSSAAPTNHFTSGVESSDYSISNETPKVADDSAANLSGVANDSGFVPTADYVDNSVSVNMQANYISTRHLYFQPWHEMIRGFPNRRYIFGLAFALAEACVTGAMVLAPIRHRSQSHQAARVRAVYWFTMACFDMLLSIPIILGYIFLFYWLEDLSNAMLIWPLFLVLTLYKLATLPLPYLVSLAAETSINAFLFILMIYFVLCWDFAIYLRTFIEWTLLNNGYLYTTFSWLLLSLPIVALVDSLTVISQLNRMNLLCSQVPAYMATRNLVDLEGNQYYTVIDNLLAKVNECLTNGKTEGVSIDVFHQGSFGILWSIYLILLTGLIGWTFLLTCERFFGILARRFNSARTSNDPMNTITRLPDNTTTSLFKWDRERDRLISEYLRCMNETNYLKLMTKNCLLLRIWLKPMGDQTSLDKRLSSLLEPLYSLGQTKNDIQVELKTTLQIFIRIGHDSSACKVDRVQLIETYTNYIEKHSDIAMKFAVVDWSQENLYKILLHGHYNAKLSTSDQK